MGANGNARRDWLEIQKIYDAGASETDLVTLFKVSTATLHRAAKRGDFVYRDRSTAQRLKQQFHPHRHTGRTKKKISEARLRFLDQNPDKVPYLLNHSSRESYPEVYFRELFVREGISLLSRYRVGRYELDFCCPLSKVDVEIDGEQHYLDPRIVENDLRRTAWLEERGWKTFRIRWSDYKKTTDEGRRTIVKNLKQFLGLHSVNS